MLRDARSGGTTPGARRLGCLPLAGADAFEPRAELGDEVIERRLPIVAADLVDRIVIYRAPIIVGEGKSSVGYIGLDAIADAHGRWRSADGAHLGIDRLEVYERVRE